MNSLYNWKFDAYRSGYVHRDTGTFVPYELLQRSGVAYRSLQIARTQNIRAAMQFTADQIEALAESLAAQKAAGEKEPCPVCDGSGSLSVWLMQVRCSVCAGRGWLKVHEEAEP